MDVPLLEFDENQRAIINAADWHPRQEGAPTSAVMTWMSNAHDAIVDRHSTGIVYEQPLESNTFTIHNIDWNGTSVALALCTVGAPAAAALLETMIAVGCERFVSIGSSGGLVPELAPGTVVVADSYLRDEGTSFHYVPPDADLLPDPALRTALSAAVSDGGLPTTEGTVWTTDAFYRETPERVARRTAAGAVAVDMEASALAAVASFRGVALASAVYLADTLYGDQWDPTELISRDEVYRTRLLSLALDAVAS